MGERGLFLILVLALSHQLLHAELVVDQFDYGDSAVDENGGAVSLFSGADGGQGFDGPWRSTSGATGTLLYDPAGLEFGSLATLGGSVYTRKSGGSAPAARNLANPFASSANSTLFGSYLYEHRELAGTPSMPLQGQIGLRVVETDSSFPRQGITYNERYSNKFRDEVSMRTSTEGAINPSSDHPLTLGEVFMKIVYADLTPSALIARMWTINSSQYEDLIQGGVTLDELLGRSTGDQAGDVLTQVALQPGSDITLALATLEFGDFENGGTVYLDELRLSNSSFNEALGVSAVPEPSSIALALTASSAILLRRRLRRRRFA